MIKMTLHDFSLHSHFYGQIPTWKSYLYLYLYIKKNDQMKVHQKVNVGIRTITDIIFSFEIFSLFKLFFN